MTLLTARVISVARRHTDYHYNRGFTKYAVADPSTPSMVKQVQFSSADGKVQLTSQLCIMLLVVQWETFLVVSKRSTILCCLSLSAAQIFHEKVP
jgi:hypothetical protein